MRKEAIRGTGNKQRKTGGGRLGGEGRERKSSVRSAGRFPRWKAARLQTRTILLSLLFALYVGTCALPMGLEGLNPLRKAAEHLIPGTDLLYYFREPVTGARPLTEFEAPGYTGKVVWESEDGFLTEGFAAETAYTAVVTLSALEGFAFNVPAASEPGSFSHSRSAGVTHAAGTGATLTITITFGATEPESGPDNPQPGAPEVVEYNLQRYVPVPVAGQTPVTNLEQPNLALSVLWQDEDGGNIEAPAKFEQGAQYRAIIMLTARGTWKFVKDYPFAYYPSASVEYQEDSTEASVQNRVVFVTYKPTGEPEKVTDLDLTRHIPAPVKGATAMWSVLGDENRYTGSMQWEVSDAAGWTDMPSGVFQPGTTYRAVAVLYAGPGYVFDQNAAVSHDDATGLSEPEIKTANVLNVTISFPATANDPVTDMNLTSKVPRPATGNFPVTSFEALQYTGTATWTNDENEPLAGAFEARTVYVAKVELQAAPGYAFVSNAVPSFSLAAVSRAVGGSVNSYFEHNNGGTVEGFGAVVTITFPRTEGDLAPVTNLDLSAYLPAPVTGGFPLPSFSAPEYTGTVAWTVTAQSAPLSGLFEANTTYTATVTLKAASDCTLEGVGVDGFTYTFSGAGGTITYDPATKTAVINFPATTQKTVDTVTDTDLTPYFPAPVTGGTPALYFYADQYWGKVAWKETAGGIPLSGLFASGAAYTATVTLTATSGYTFAGAGNFSHGSITGLAPSINNDGKATVTINFPKSGGGSAADIPIPW